MLAQWGVSLPVLEPALPLLAGRGLEPLGLLDRHGHRREYRYHGAGQPLAVAGRAPGNHPDGSLVAREFVGWRVLELANPRGVGRVHRFDGQARPPCGARQRLRQTAIGKAVCAPVVPAPTVRWLDSEVFERQGGHALVCEPVHHRLR